MSLTLLLELAAKSAIVSGAALLLLQLLKNRSAAERSWLAHAALVVLLLLPVVSLAAPQWRLRLLPAQPPAVIVLPSAAVQADAAAPATIVPTASALIDLQLLPLALYALGAGALLLVTLLAVGRLFALRARAAVLVEPAWLSALAHAQRRMGVKNGTALLVSDQVTSPVSWGMLRPVIVLNEKVVPLHDGAEAIIAHELAHVVRLDWAKLLAARVATALFWFNPLVWALARQCHQLREEAADDAVLRSDVPSADYAALLVQAARHEQRSTLMAAHGVAPSRGSLHRRVTRALDKTSRRAPAALAWATGCLVGASLIATPLSAVTFERVTARPILIARSSPAAAPQQQVAAGDRPAPLQRPTSGSPREAEPIVLAAAPSASATDTATRALAGPVPVTVRVPVVVPPARGGEGLASGLNPLAPDFGDKIGDRVAAATEMGEGLHMSAQTKQEFARLGYKLDQEGEFMFMAMRISPAYVRELRSVGYANLEVEQLVALHTMGVSADFVRKLQKPGGPKPTFDELVAARGHEMQRGAMGLLSPRPAAPAPADGG